MKNLPLILVLALIGGFIGSYAYLNFFAENYLAEILGASFSAGSPVSEVQVRDDWEKIITSAVPGTVAIQVFRDNKLFRQGTGLVLSSDGIIATVGDMGISGGVYQISYNGQILRGNVIALDNRRNVLLLRTQSTYSNIAGLISSGSRSGQEVALIGRMLELSGLIDFAQKGLISYISGGNIFIDTAPGDHIRGAGVIDSSGNFIGMSYVRKGKVILVQAGSVSAVFEEYIKKNNGG